MGERSGWECPSCKHFNRFPLYVHAHWNEILTGTCEGCGAGADIYEGRVVRYRGVKKKAEKKPGK